jgi:hypothetical protein
MRSTNYDKIQASDHQTQKNAGICDLNENSCPLGSFTMPEPSSELSLRILSLILIVFQPKKSRNCKKLTRTNSDKFNWPKKKNMVRTLTLRVQDLIKEDQSSCNKKPFSLKINQIFELIYCKKSIPNAF